MTDQYAQPFQQIVQAVLDDIRSGKLKAGDKLPTTSQFVERFDVAPGTVQRALSELRASQVIYSQQGRGSFVRDTSAVAPPTGTLDALAQELAELRARVERLEKQAQRSAG